MSVDNLYNMQHIHCKSSYLSRYDDHTLSQHTEHRLQEVNSHGSMLDMYYKCHCLSKLGLLGTVKVMEAKVVVVKERVVKEKVVMVMAAKEMEMVTGSKHHYNSCRNVEGFGHTTLYVTVKIIKIQRNIYENL